MNGPVRRVAVAVLVLFLALLVAGNVVQVGQASSLRNNPHNYRVLISEYSRERGPIVVDGKAVAQSVKTNDSLEYLRTYPGGPAFAPATGYYSLVYGASAIEHQENALLAGSDDRLFIRRLTDIITGRKPKGGAVVLTLNRAAQEAAVAGLAGRKGAVVALDPSTGAILALATSPSYDPAKLSSHDTAAIRRYWDKLTGDPAQPLLDRALSARYPPGSLFKVVTLSAALSTGRYRADTRIPSPTELPLPLTTATIKNFGGEVCGDGHTDTVADAFRISCNTAFAALGMKLGADKMRSQAKAFGIGSGLSVPMPVAHSVFPDQPNAPQLAQSSIGQFDVALTPLQAAMIVAGIADKGVVMKPYLVKELQGPDLSTLSTTQPKQLSRAVSPAVAAQVTRLMELVVNSGTGTAAQIPGVAVAGKTGTAQNAPGKAPHAWFGAFAPANHPQVAVAVIVESGGGLGSDATGGRVAAPIAKAVIEAVLGR